MLLGRRRIDTPRSAAVADTGIGGPGGRPPPLAPLVRSQPSGNGGRFPQILDLFQGSIISSQWVSRGNIDF